MKTRIPSLCTNSPSYFLLVTLVTVVMKCLCSCFLVAFQDSLVHAVFPVFSAPGTYSVPNWDFLSKWSGSVRQGHILLRAAGPSQSLKVPVVFAGGVTGCVRRRSVSGRVGAEVRLQNMLQRKAGLLCETLEHLQITSLLDHTFPCILLTWWTLSESSKLQQDKK